jgi:hypothetical protein
MTFSKLIKLKTTHQLWLALTRVALPANAQTQFDIFKRNLIWNYSTVVKDFKDFKYF